MLGGIAREGMMFTDGGIAREGMMFTDYFPRRSTPLQRHADISRQSAGKVDDLGS
jgi:hypothetical protein